MKKLALFIALLAMLPALAQQRDKALTIAVSTAGGAVVTDASVKLTQTDYSLSYGTLKLNAQGAVTVKVYAGNHRLEVSKAGYDTHVSNFQVTADTTVNVTMAEQTLVPFSLGVDVAHDAATGMNDVTFTWNQEAPVFFDDFESYEPFALAFGEWTGIDNDGLIAAPLVGDYPNRGVRQYAQVINPMTVEPSWWYDYPILRPYGGQQYVGFTRTFSGAANDDWLISPVVTPGNMNTLAFRGKAADQYKERFQVYVTTVTDNPAIADFVKINSGNYETADYTGWRLFTYDLSQYAGRPIRFAIRYISEANVSGAFMLMVDDVFVGQVYDEPAQAVARARARRLAPQRSPMNPNEHFKVYLNGELTAETDSYQHVFSQLPAGTYTLGVQAVYTDSQTAIADTTIVIENHAARLTVLVETNNGQSLDGAVVEATDKVTAAVYRAVIADGQAVFVSLPFGQYMVGVNAPHYQVVEQDLTLEADATITLSVKEQIVDPYNITVDVEGGQVTGRWNQNLSFKDSFEDYPDFARLTFGEWNAYLLQMLQLGLIDVMYDEANHLHITPYGKDVLFGRATVMFSKYVKQLPAGSQSKKPAVRPVFAGQHTDEVDTALFEKLRNLRLAIARASHIPPYTVFSDKVLAVMAREKPTTQAEFGTLYGVGEAKTARYWRAFTSVIKQQINQNRPR